MFRSKYLSAIFLLMLVLSASAIAQELLPLSGDPSAKEWSGKELGTPYKIKPFEIQPKPKRYADPEKIDEPTKESTIENRPDYNKPNEDITSQPISEIRKEPEPRDKYWIKGEFFGFEPIPDDQPGIYGNYDGGNLNASIILAEGGFFTFEHPDSPDEFDRNFGFGKLYLQIDIPVIDYWMLQVGVGALTCMLFDTTVDSIMSNIDIVDNSNQFGWVAMCGTSVLLELSRYMGFIPWGQFFYGNAGFSEEQYTFMQIRAGLRYFIQMSREGIFAIFLGPTFNSISADLNDENQSSAGLAIEGGFLIADVIQLRVIYGLEESLEFRFSIGTAF